jgi:hypothetical protein
MILMVLALLGDNPMQSEFACHIGLKGKFFCRACWVKGSDAQAEVVQDILRDPNASDIGSKRSGNESLASDGAGEGTDVLLSGKKTKSHGKRALKSFGSMVDKVKAFVKV